MTNDFDDEQNGLYSRLAGILALDGMHAVTSMGYRRYTKGKGRSRALILRERPPRSYPADSYSLAGTTTEAIYQVQLKNNYRRSDWTVQACRQRLIWPRTGRVDFHGIARIDI